MATNLISAITADAPLRIQRNGTDVAKGIATSRVILRLTSNPLRHMREDGSTIVDSRIIMPALVMIEAFAPDNGTAGQIGDALSDRSNLYSVTSKGIKVNDVLLENVQIKQVPEALSAIPMRISFKQVLTKISAQKITAQASDASVIDRGITFINQSTQTVTTLFNKISGAI